MISPDLEQPLAFRALDTLLYIMVAYLALIDMKRGLR